MADVTVNANSIDASAWASPSGSITDIDEAIASADGNLYSAGGDSAGSALDLGLTSPGLLDSDTITQVDVTVRCSATGTAGNKQLGVDLLIGGTVQGSQQLTGNLSGTLSDEGPLNHAGWNTDWSASQLDGMQVRLTGATTGMPGTCVPSVDCIDVLITYTPGGPTEETVAATTTPSASLTEQFLLGNDAQQAVATRSDLYFPPEHIIVPRMIPSSFHFPAVEVEDSSLSPVEITRTDVGLNETTQSAYTFSSLSLGAAVSGRVIAVVIHARGNNALPTITSCTVAGGSAIERIDIAGNDGGNLRSNSGLYTITDEVNATGDIVVTWPQSKLVCAVEVYRIVNAGAEAPTDSATGTNADPINLASITTAAGGGVIACYTSYGGSTADYTWTNITEDIELFADSMQRGTAFDDNIAGGSLSVSIDNADNITNNSAYVATWDSA